MVVANKRVITNRLTVIDDDVRKKVLEVLESEPYYAGPETAAFEEEVAAYCGSAHGVSANSGTSALLLTLMAAGVGPGDEVILPTNTFVSVPEVVMFLGATPVFSDVEIDGNLSRSIIEPHLTERTRAIIPVHMFGHPVDMDPIMELATERGLYVVEDAAHALGARYKGRRVGSIGHAGMFSFAGKSLTVCGQAGMAITDDAELAEKMAMMRVHGWRQRIGGVDASAELLGLNLRTSEVLSAIGRVHLAKLDDLNARRRANAVRLSEIIGSSDAPVTLPVTRSDQEPGWLHFVIRAPERDALRDHLRSNGVRTGVHYEVPLHRQPAFEGRAPDASAFPISEQLARESLTLPSNPWLSADDIEYIGELVVGFYTAAHDDAQSKPAPSARHI